MLATPYWVDFDLGEDVRSDTRLAQDAAWAGAVQDGRAHISHREATLKHAHRFRDSLAGYHMCEDILDMMTVDDKKTRNRFQDFNGKEFIVRNILEYLWPGHGPLVMASLNRRKLAEQQRNSMSDNANNGYFRLCTRKRPILSYEKIIDGAIDGVKKKEEDAEGNFVHLNYDAVSTPVVPDTSITFHQGQLARNGRRLSMAHHTYQVNRVYSADATNAELTASEMMPMLQHTLLGNNGESRGKATLICFGQTGTGKTYTLNACLEYLIHHVVHSHIYGAKDESTAMTVTFFEVFGKKCFDLLNDRATCRLLADGNDKMHLRGAKEECFSRQTLAEQSIATQEEAEAYILKVLADGMDLRSSQQTERNPLSSRSHAVCTLKFTTRGDGDKNESGGESFIRLVDLAGSERNYETLKMAAREHMESADINTALMSLKDCFRAAAAKASGEKVIIQATTAVDNHFSVFAKGGSRDPSKFAPKKSRPKPKIHNYQGMIPMVSKLDTEEQEDKENESGDSKKEIANNGRTLRPAAKALARVPFRAHLLTRVLKDCFEGDATMMTTLIATVSPSPTDLLHSLNTLDHVICMNKHLEKLKSEVSVDIPIFDFFSPTSPVETWTPEHVQNWLATVDGGRFSMLQVPPDLDGKGLASLEVSSLTALFAGTLRKARQGEEGAAWVVDNAIQQGQGSTIGRALWGSIRREEEAIKRRKATEEREFK